MTSFNFTRLIPSLIVVGSTNPVKTKAVKSVLQPLSDHRLDFKSVSVDSAVSYQPFSSEETCQGAINRAVGALRKVSRADWGIGLEGGVSQVKYKDQKGKIVVEIVEVAWCAIINRQHNIALGGGAQFQLPPVITNRLKQGEELGPVIGELTNDINMKKKQGVVGVLSANLLTRQSIYEQLVKLALVKIISQSKDKKWWQ